MAPSSALVISWLLCALYAADIGIPRLFDPGSNTVNQQLLLERYDLRNLGSGLKNSKCKVFSHQTVCLLCRSTLISALASREAGKICRTHSKLIYKIRLIIKIKTLFKVHCENLRINLCDSYTYNTIII